MICKKCGKENAEGSNFCVECQAALDTDSKAVNLKKDDECPGSGVHLDKKQEVKTDQNTVNPNQNDATGPKQKDTSQARQTYTDSPAEPMSGGSWKKKLRTGIVILILIGIVANIFDGDKAKINMVKKGTMASSGATVEELLKKRFGNKIDWDYEEDSDGFEIVTAKFKGMLYEETGSFTVEFLLHEGEDTFEIYRVTFKGESSWLYKVGFQALLSEEE